jgi:hypothetical protein
MASRRSSKRSSKARKSTRGPRGARGAAGRPAGQTAVWLGALALAGVAAVGTAVYFSEKKSAPTPLPPGPNGQVTATLTQGHRYTVSFTCPSATSNPQISGITGVSLVSTTPAPNGGVIVFDYTGASGSYPIAAAGCSVSIADNGVSPTPSLPSTGDVYSSLSSAQQSALQSALYAYVSQTPSPCPTVSLTGINGASDLSDAGNRSSAVDCFQTGYNAKSGTQLGAANGPGVLDAATYMALMSNS